MDYLLSGQQLNNLIDKIVEEAGLTSYHSEFTRSYSYFYAEVNILHKGLKDVG